MDKKLGAFRAAHEKPKPPIGYYEWFLFRPDYWWMFDFSTSNETDSQAKARAAKELNQ